MRATLARPSFSLAGTPSICGCVSHVTRHGMSWRCKVARSRASKRRSQRCTVSSWEVFPAWRWDEVRHINCFDCVKTAQFLCARGALAKGRSCVKLLRPGQSRAAAISVYFRVLGPLPGLGIRSDPNASDDPSRGVPLRARCHESSMQGSCEHAVAGIGASSGPTSPKPAR